MLSAIAIGAAMVALVPAPAFAATFTVDSGVDDVTTVGSLRWAITQAESNAGPDTINITYTGTIAAGATDLPPITEDLTITGPGSGQLTVEAFATAFTINSGASVTISGMRVDAPTMAIDASGGGDLTVSDFASGDPVNGGGQISYVGDNASSDVSLSSVTVEDGADDGIYIELNGGNATLNNVTISNRGTQGLEFGDGDFGELIVDGLDSSSNDANGVLLSWIGGTVSISNSTASSNGESGFVLEIQDDVVLTGTGLHADKNTDLGFALSTLDTSSIDLNNATANDGDGLGVAIEEIDPGAKISLTGFEVRRNAVGGISAAISGSPIGILGKLVIRQTTVADHTAVSSFLGPLFLTGDGNGEVVLDQVSVLNNSGSGALSTGMLFLITGAAKVTISNSTVARNSGEALSGIGVFTIPTGPSSNYTGTVVIQNVTVSNNSAPFPGISIQDASTDLASTPNWSILNSTISDNTSLDTGSSPQYYPSVSLQHVNALVENSILSGSNFADIGQVASTVSINYSLIQSEDGSLTSEVASGIGNLTGVSPNLAALANNGGPTLTRLPNHNSLVLEAGDPLFSGLTTDQRGETRVVGRLDMGAVELGPILAETGVDFGLPLGMAIFLLLSGAIALEATRRLRRA